MNYELRTKQLEIELKKAINDLNEYKKVHEEFILLASHELHTPLRKLSTFVERFTHKFSETSGEAKPYIERIQSIVTNMRSMIDSISILSDITEAKDNFSKCDLGRIFQNILKEIGPVISENKAVINFSALPVIEGNCSMLKQLFENIIDNSIKFQQENTSIKIKVDSEQIDDEEKKVLGLSDGKIYYKIQFMDNGIGFDDQNSENIFQPFVRLNGKSEYEGNGLGLAICKKIIEKHHGIIYAEGTKNSGAGIILILPESSN